MLGMGQALPYLRFHAHEIHKFTMKFHPGISFYVRDISFWPEECQRDYTI